MRPWILVLAVLLAFTTFAQAAPVIMLTPMVVQSQGVATVTLEWNVTPASSQCEAFGSWTGPRPLSGSENVGEFMDDASFGLSCTQPGESTATFTWVNATQNTNGSTYADPKATLFKIRFDGGPLDLATVCNGPVRCSQINDAPGNRPTVHTVTGITDLGQMRVAAFHINQRDESSQPSNIAAKIFDGASESMESIVITVNPVPAGPSNLAIE